MRRSFVRILKVLPTDYRARFRSLPITGASSLRFNAETVPGNAEYRRLSAPLPDDGPDPPG
jgi:hypothetical protein